jgi:hypothetical protein
MIANAGALAMSTCSVMSVSTNLVVWIVQSYSCSLFFIRLCNFVNKISENMGLRMKSKANVKTGFVNQRIANPRRFMKPSNVD